MKTKNIIASIAGATAIGAALLLTNNTAPTIQHTAAWKEYYPGGYWVTGNNLKPGDTLHMNKGVYSYISGENLNNVTFWPDEGTEMTNGINLTNSSNIHIAGLDANTGRHKLYIHDAPGVAIQATGKCNKWEIDGVDMYNVYSWLWFKTDPDNFHKPNGDIDTSYWNIVMDGLYVHDCILKKSKFDGSYIGNTDPQAKRPYVIGGKTYYTFPPQVSHIRFKNVIMDTSYRTNLQVSCLLDSVILDNVTAKNAGINSYLDADGKHQGANFIIGGAKGSIYASITNCTFDNSNLYNVRTQAGGKIVFADNKTDSATAVYRIGKGFSVNDEKMAAVEFDNPIETDLTIAGNTIGWSNNNVGIVVYGKMKAGSKYSGNKLRGVMQNFTGTGFDTTTVPVTPEPPKELAVIVSFTLNEAANTATFKRADGSDTIVTNVQRAVGAINNKHVKTWVWYDLNKKKHTIK